MYIYTHIYIPRDWWVVQFKSLKYISIYKYTSIPAAYAYWFISAAHCKTLLHTTIHCNTSWQQTPKYICIHINIHPYLQYIHIYSYLQHTAEHATHSSSWQQTPSVSEQWTYPITHSNTQQHHATHRCTLQHTATRCNTKRPGTFNCTLFMSQWRTDTSIIVTLHRLQQQTATHYNTPQHTATRRDLNTTHWIWSKFQ